MDWNSVRAIARRRKRLASFTQEQIIICSQAKHSWTTLRVSRPLFVGNKGSYLQVTCWALGQ